MTDLLRHARPALLTGALLALAGGAHAQSADAAPVHTENIKVLSHVELGDPLSVSDLELEQDLDRPFAYVGRMFVHGFDVIDLRDPGNADVLYSWRIEDAELHTGTGMMDGKLFRDGGRWYYVDGEFPAR